MTNKIDSVIKLLRLSYPDSKVSLDFSTPWELLVATILSAQSTDITVNKVTPQLFQKYPTIHEIVNADLSDIEEIIRPCGLFTRKAKSIKDGAKVLVKNFNSEIPKNMIDLLKLPGVGRKTANVILGVAYQIPEGIVVDTHVKRISKLLGWTNEENPDKIEKDLKINIPKNYWLIISHLLIDHGREICKARKPFCERCSIEVYCPSSKLKK
ncbi:MAG: endonuclease III [Candidatus Hodarchaeales archaeon]|jgi:endonuclease-3